jgi:hypothetical protein
MVKRLSFLCVLNCLLISIYAAGGDDLLSPVSPTGGMGSRLHAFCGILTDYPAARFASADELSRMHGELLPTNEYNDPVDDPILYLHSLFENGSVDQEALVREKSNLTSAFQAVIASSTPEIRALIPDSTNLEADFSQCFSVLNGFYSYVLIGKFSKKQKFMARNAMETLSLLNGDETICRHRISSVVSYSDCTYPSLPNAKHLFVFACKLSDVLDPGKFVLAYLSENFSKPSKWCLWKQPFERHFPGILTYDDLGLALAADKASGGKFVKSMAEFLKFGEVLPCPAKESKELRVMSDLYKAYIHNSLERINPITEALFMARRGHNINLFDAAESNRPACAEGLYLNLIRETSAMLSGVFVFDEVRLVNCV